MKIVEKPVRTLPRGLPTMNDRIEYLRCVLGYPFTPFATKVGSAPNALSKVLQGKSNPSMSLITNILKIFPVNEEWMYLGAGEPFKVDDISEFMYGGGKVEDGIDAEINERFREIRLDQGLSQPLFANELGITKDIVAFIEVKRSNVSVELIKKLSKKFNVSEMWMLYGTGNKYKVKK